MIELSCLLLGHGRERDSTLKYQKGKRLNSYKLTLRTLCMVHEGNPPVGASQILSTAERRITTKVRKVSYKLRKHFTS
jgi:hypothetical protein